MDDIAFEKVLEQVKTLTSEQKSILLKDLQDSTFTEEIVESMCGIFNAYADVNLVEKENKAWENAVKNKYDR